MNRSTLGLLAAGAATLVMSGAAVAATTGEARSVRVSYADLDLDKATDAARLYARLRSAADAVCEIGDRRDLHRAVLYGACFDKALGDAVAAVGSPQLSARYLGVAAGSRRSPAA